MKPSRAILFIIAAATLLNSGCALVGCDRVFPKLTWYWSAEAIRCREEHRLTQQADEEYARTNQVHSITP